MRRIAFENESMSLVPPPTLDPFIHVEWFVSMNTSSTIIFDIENLDGNTPAELILYKGKSLSMNINDYVLYKYI